VGTWKQVVASNQRNFSADAEVIQQSTAYSLDSSEAAEHSTQKDES